MGLPASIWAAYQRRNLAFTFKHQKGYTRHYFVPRKRFFSYYTTPSSASQRTKLQQSNNGLQIRTNPYNMSRVQKDFDSIKEANNTEPDTLQRPKGKKPHVGIIGAGVAGLRCADVLLKHGVKVTILEGRDRVGGRFYQSDALGHRVDLGPNWIHGTGNNPMVDLTKETDTATMSWDGRQAIFDQLGRLLSEDESAEVFEIVWTIIEQAMKYSNEECETISPEISLYDYFKEKIGEFGVSVEKQERILHVAEMWGAFVGSTVQQQSLKFFWMEDSLDGENLFVEETYHKVLKKIAEPALKDADIKFGYKAKKIITHETPDGINVTVESLDKESLTFDELVTTTPLGWLKANKDAFEPELPVRLQQAITSIGYGHLDKVYITFPTAFWNEHPQPSSNPESTDSPLNLPGFIQWTTPTYATQTNPSHWAQEAMNLASLTPSHAHPTLLFYTYGQTSLHIASLLKSASPSLYSDKQQPSPSLCSEAVKSLLLPFFTPYFSCLPNYSPTNPEHQPIALLATGWANDELAGNGSYSNFPVGLEKGGEDVEVMRKGMPERGVWIAGEHTAPFAGLGTVHGAYWSGEGVAGRLLGAYGVEKVE
ncbi:FAD/NAD(P)-binding domain-containing protein [Periconia macrospinosa]|uniref:FAD/NAD(P)-binding domain-containing protein n=1 Tax=Periconia macrospinosa TaxID=97972 RepID=A0A2V1E3K2_9PLEO|nr:FAD/NAD(P)-binding domain-containing protein [Periconia macrospinosa]